MIHPPLPDCGDTACHRRLGRLLAARLAPMPMMASGARSWASASFNGARHWFELQAAATADPAALAAELHRQFGAAEWAIAGQLVADIAVTAPDTQGEAVIRVECLTVAVD